LLKKQEQLQKPFREGWGFNTEVMAKPRKSTDELAEIISDKFYDLEKFTKRLEKTVTKAESTVLEINRKPLEEFDTKIEQNMEGFNIIVKKLGKYKKGIIIAFSIMFIVTATAVGAAVYLFTEKQRWEDLAHQWREAAVELGYEKSNDNQNN